MNPSSSFQDELKQNTQGKVRYAVVGLGWISQAAVLPAFIHAENSELVALISDDPTKLAELSQSYDGVQHTFSYEEYEDCLSSGLVDAVYIALPNHLHCDYTVRAARLGIHVLCEKPMATSVEECERMIQVCDQHQVKLMIAYRLHFEAANMQAVEIVKSGKIGEPRLFSSVFTQQVKAGDIRLLQATGGGTLDDIGIYCINAARYLFQAEPIEVFATTANNGEERFNQVEEMSSAIMRFPGDRLACFTCSFGAALVSTYEVVGTAGRLRLDPAYGFQGDLKYELTVNGETQEQTFPQHDQFAAELIYFSDCILQDKTPEPSGVEGLLDIRIIRALYHSIATGSFVRLNSLERQQRRPDSTQTIDCPAPPSPPLVHATDPSGQS